MDFYLQDSWRVSKRFTAEIGLRLDHMGAPFDQSGDIVELLPYPLFSRERARALSPGL